MTTIVRYNDKLYFDNLLLIASHKGGTFTNAKQPKVYKHPSFNALIAISGALGEFGYLYTISVDDLKKCQALREEKKFNEITALWSCKELAEVTIAEVTFDDLKPFNWASVEMM